MTHSVLPVPSDWTARRVALATLVVCAVAAAFWLLYRYYAVPFLVFVSILVGTAIRPAVEWLRQRGLPRALGIVALYLVLLGLTILFVSLVAPLLAQQVTTIVAKLPDYYHGIHDLLSRSHNTALHRLGLQLPQQLSLLNRARGGPQALESVAQLLGYVKLIGSSLFVVVSVLVLAFYWTLDGTRTLRGLLLRLPADRRGRIHELLETMETKVGAYLVGQTIVCASVGVMALVAYLVIGVPYALALGLLAGVLEAVPVVGPILGAAPPALLTLSLAPEKLIWVVVAVVVIQQVENNLLIPRVMDRAVGVNPVVTILAIAAFASLFGLAGALLAIPLAAIIQVLLNHFVLSPAAPESELPERRDRLSILRYEAQELVRDVRKQVRRKEEAVDGEADRLEDLIESIASDLDSVLARANGREEEV